MKTIKIFGLVLLGLALAGAAVYACRLKGMMMDLRPQASAGEPTVRWRSGAVELETPAGWLMMMHRTEFASFRPGETLGLKIEERPYPPGLPPEAVFNDRLLAEPFAGIKSSPRYQRVELAEPDAFPRRLKAVAWLDNLSRQADYHVFILYHDHYLYLSFVLRPENKELSPEQNFHSKVLAEQLAGLEDLYLDDRAGCTGRDMFTAFGCARPDQSRFQIRQQLILADDAGKAALMVWNRETGLPGAGESWRPNGFNPDLNDYRTLTARLIMPLLLGLHPQTIEHEPTEINGLKALRKVVTLYKILPWGMDEEMPAGQASLSAELYLRSDRSAEAGIYDTWLSSGISGPAPESEAEFNRFMGTTERIWLSVRDVSVGSDDNNLK